MNKVGGWSKNSYKYILLYMTTHAKTLVSLFGVFFVYYFYKFSFHKTTPPFLVFIVEKVAILGKIPSDFLQM